MKNSLAATSISARFAAAARTYDLESGVQMSVAENLSAFLPLSETIGSVLEIGCGTGYFTEILAKRFPPATIDALDISAPMIDSARKRIAESANICWHTADARTFCPGRQFSLIASSSALHWITPADVIMKRIAALLEPCGSVAAALMVQGTLGELFAARTRLFPQKALPVLLPAEGEILKAVEAAGLDVVKSRCETLQKTCGSTRELLRSLNRQGVTGRSDTRCALLNRTELHELIDYYDRQFCAPQGGVTVTWRVLYVTARK